MHETDRRGQPGTRRSWFKTSGLLPDMGHFVLGVLITVAAEVVIHHSQEPTSTSKFNLALVLAIAGSGVAFVLLGRIIYVLNQRYEGTNARVEEMTRRIGVRTKLMSFPDAYGEAERAVQNAKEEILCVTNWALANEPQPGTQLEMKSYYSSVLDDVLLRGIVYERIIQVDPPGEEKVQRNKPLLSHLRKCIEKRDEMPGKTKIGLFRCPPFTLVSFLLVDKTYLFFQLDEYNNKTQCFQVSKCLIVEDNTKDVASAFRELFDDLKRRSDRMTIDHLNRIERRADMSVEA
ncbi:MAG TPA: hypothetical protein VJ723_13950 [Candidatus Angelobacter sp.]|nr:hypothetical protein [Candidatus Angelobacter sp.]